MMGLYTNGELINTVMIMSYENWSKYGVKQNKKSSGVNP
jgi:hypothetical protein